MVWSFLRKRRGRPVRHEDFNAVLDAVEDIGNNHAVTYGPSGEILLHDTGTGGVGRYTRTGGPQEDVHLRTGDAAGSIAFVEGQSSGIVAANISYDGANWNLFDTGQSGFVFYVGTGGVNVYTATAGANPRTLVGPQTLAYAQFAGLASLGTVLAAQRTSNLAVSANTNTTLQSLTVTEGKWWVQGFSYVGTPGVANTTVDLWLNGFTVPSMVYLPTTSAGITGLTPPAIVSVASGSTTAVDLTARGNSTFTSYGTGGVAGFGNVTGIVATRIG